MQYRGFKEVSSLATKLKSQKVEPFRFYVQFTFGVKRK